MSLHLFSLTLHRPVATCMTVVAVVVFGLVSLTRLNLALLPDISYPTITVRTQLPGAPPTEVEAKVSTPLEDSLGNLRRLERISSRSHSGTSDVILEFEWGADLDLALVEISERLDKAFLPREAVRPVVLRYDPSQDPILRIGLWSDVGAGTPEGGSVDPVVLRRISEEDIARQLAGIEGVASVRVVGGREEEIRVAIDEQRLRKVGLDLAAISQHLARENINLASGMITEGGVDYVVRTLNEFRDLGEIADLIVADRGEAKIRLRDIGSVERIEREPEVLTRISGGPSVEIEIHKEADANAVAVAAAVREKLFGATGSEEGTRAEYATKLAERRTAVLAEQKRKAEERAKREAAGGEAATAASGRKPGAGGHGGQGGHGDEESRVPPVPEPTPVASLPANVHLAVIADQSLFISDAIAEVRSSAVWGAALAVLVLLVFLRRPSATVVVATAIPISVVATFVPMQLTGTSLNVMSLGGLALGIGMLVDNAIVVIESISRCREEGDDLLEAAARGTREVGSAVIASTLTTIAVFFPIVFVEGIAGQVFRDQALTVVFSLLASLGVALFFIPMLSSRQRPSLPDSGGSGAGPRQGAYSLFEERWHARQLQFGAGAQLRAGLGLPALCLRGAGEALLDAGLDLVRILLRLFVDAAMNVFVLLALAVPFPPLWRLADRNTKGRYGAPRLSPVVTGAVIPPTPLRRMLWWAGFPYVYLRGLLAILMEGLLACSGHVLLLIASVGASLALAAIFLATVILFPVLAILTGVLALVQDAYPQALGAALRHRWEVVVACSLLLVATAALAGRLGSELVPEVHQGEFSLHLAAPPGTPIDRTDALIARAEAALAETPGIDRWITRVGVEREANPDTDEGSHSAEILVVLDPTDRSPAAHERVQEALRQRIQIPGLETLEFRAPTLLSFSNPIEVEISGHELPILSRISDQVVEILEGARRPDGSPLVEDVKATLGRGTREILLTYDRERLARFGLTTGQVAEALRHKVSGETATAFREKDRRIDIITRVDELDADSVEDVLGLIVARAGTRDIALRDIVADVVEAEGPTEVRRINHRRATVVAATPTGLDLARTVGVLESRLGALELPQGFKLGISGQFREMERSSGSMLFALALASFLVYVVMASQFEHLVQPLVIMVSLPLAAVGVVAALYLTATPLSVLVFIGLIVLAGIVVNNAIVLIDYTNQLRRDRGMERDAAVKQAGQVRLRPILMTTTTTVMALIPLALGLGEGGELRAPLAITVVAGLLSSTLLTLVVIPVVYTLADDLVARVRSTPAVAAGRDHRA